MDAKIKALWTDALRSGDYKQGEGALRKDGEDGPTFCCLGVLCEVAVKNGLDISVKSSAPIGVVDGCNCRICANALKGPTTTYYDNRSSFPSVNVLEWAGLAKENPSVGYNGQQLTLAQLNDENKLPFADIADLIDAQL